MRHFRFLIQRLAVGLLGVFLLTSCAGGIQPRSTNEEVFKLKSWGGPSLEVLTYRPEAWRPDSPTIIVLHGSNRNINYVTDTWVPLAEEYGFLLAIPYFDEWNFSGSDGYQLGSVREGKLSRRSSFNAIEPLFDELRDRYSLSQSGYRLFGHSAGAQFVHRFMWLHPEARVEKAVVSMAGWYTLPDDSIAWPYGLGGTGKSIADIARPLSAKLVVQLGELDINPDDDDLRQTSDAVSQGPHRYARGRNFYHQAQIVAQEKNLPFGWRLENVKKAGHESSAGAQQIASWLAE